MDIDTQVDDTAPGDDGDGALLVLTADELTALQGLFEHPFPPGIGPSDDADVNAAAGTRSLIARALLDGAGHLADELAVLLSVYASATRRLSVLEHGPDGDVQQTLHVAKPVGVLHRGRPGGLHLFTLVESTFDLDELLALVLGGRLAPSDSGGCSVEDLADHLTSFAEITVMRRDDGAVTGHNAVVAFTDAAWLISEDRTHAVGATAAVLGSALGFGV